MKDLKDSQIIVVDGLQELFKHRVKLLSLSIGALTPDLYITARADTLLLVQIYDAVNTFNTKLYFYFVTAIILRTWLSSVKPNSAAICFKLWLPLFRRCLMSDLR